jgi:hypothetical protein
VRIVIVKRILETSASRYVNEFGWPTPYIGLKEHNRGQVKAIILGREDGFVAGLVLDKQE